VLMVLWRRSSFFTECYNFTTLVDRFSKVIVAFTLIQKQK
jgi:hypothetical protein